MSAPEWMVQKAHQFLLDEIKLYRASHEVSKDEEWAARNEIYLNPRLSFAEAIEKVRGGK